MKTIVRIFSLLCLAALLLTACGPVAPTAAPQTEAQKPTATMELNILGTPIAPIRTPLSTPTRPAATATPIPTEFVRPSFVVEPPTLPVSAYRLREWGQADYAGIEMALEEDSLGIDWPYDYAIDSRSVMAAERLLRFPADPQWMETAWAGFLESPQRIAFLPGMRSEQDVFSFLLENLLNDQNIPVGRLETRLNDFGIYLDESITMSDLTGDGQDASVLSLTVRFEYEAVYAVRTAGGRYQVETILPWAEDGPGYSRVYQVDATGDLNGNGRAEIIVKESVGYSGMDGACTSDLYIAEWDQESLTFQTDILSSWGLLGPEGECRVDWEESLPDAVGIRTIMIRRYVYTHESVRIGEEQCPDLAIESSYRWNGAYYMLVDQTIIPPETDSPACRLAWVNTAIEMMPYAWEDDRVTAMISDLLAAWPEELNTIWGPASQDYFRLRLGIWQDLRGESAQATATLDNLVRNPVNAEYDFASQLASIYVTEKGQRGMVPACRAIATATDESLDALLPAMAPYRNVEQILQSWGFADQMWMYFFRQVDFCPEKDAIRSAAQRLQLADGSEIGPWAAQNGLTWLQTIPVDLNGDGMQDWLAWVSSGQGATLWAFFKDSTGTDAQFVTSAGLGNGGTYPDTSIISFRPAPGESMILAARIGEYFRLFSITGIDQVEQMFSYYESGNYHTYGDVGVTSFQFDEATTEFRISTFEQCEKEQDIIYRWAENTHQLVRREEGFDFDTAQREAERLIFQEQDFPAAIAFIVQTFAQAPDEPLQVMTRRAESCEYYPDWYHPSLRYLLALAYEMNGQPGQAVVTCYELWRDYPNNAFGILAQLKLEPVEP